MKRILSMGLALLMLLSAVCVPVSASMPDNPHPYDHEGYIRPGDKFRPYDALTRAENNTANTAQAFENALSFITTRFVDICGTTEFSNKFFI